MDILPSLSDSSASSESLSSSISSASLPNHLSLKMIEDEGRSDAFLLEAMVCSICFAVSHYIILFLIIFIVAG
ncbi:unnamed protein product [Onchocerca flexuosa]|uniref:Wsv410 n=1 Tax=Onchocerca flexuosa TaxID=387005 RepID=A0A183H2F4_9BILA|nr:unnamed protein product [Onchocerca flexuosa]